MAIPEQFLSDHLFLLVGTNPLPNYVAARLLLQPGGTMHLFHSESVTQGLADNLAKVLAPEPADRDSYSLQPGQIELIPIDPADSQKIRTTIHDTAVTVLKVTKEPTVRIGLNYTGGTKAMAVHAYRALDRLRDNADLRPGRKPVDVVFSYLDAQHLSLRFDMPGGQLPQEYPAWSEPAAYIKIRELARLHGETLGDEALQPAPAAPALAEKLTRLCSQQSTAAAWGRWCRDRKQGLANIARDDDDWYEHEALVHARDVPWPENGAIRAFLQSEFATGARGLNLRDSAAKAGFADIGVFAQWLDGKWLEDHVLASVRQVAERAQIHDCGRHVESLRGTARHHFEIDVAAMRGYQLFAISCSSTADKDLAASKTFEAWSRARQLGGDEARVAVVTFFEKPEALSARLEQDWLAPGRITAFGVKHLPRLPDYLKAWFRNELGGKKE